LFVSLPLQQYILAGTTRIHCQYQAYIKNPSSGFSKSTKRNSAISSLLSFYTQTTHFLLTSTRPQIPSDFEIFHLLLSYTMRKSMLGSLKEKLSRGESDKATDKSASRSSLALSTAGPGSESEYTPPATTEPLFFLTASKKEGQILDG
jgi:hypothetical protein